MTGPPPASSNYNYQPQLAPSGQTPGAAPGAGYGQVAMGGTQSPSAGPQIPNRPVIPTAQVFQQQQQQHQIYAQQQAVNQPGLAQAPGMPQYGPGPNIPLPPAFPSPVMASSAPLPQQPPLQPMQFPSTAPPFQPPVHPHQPLHHVAGPQGGMAGQPQQQQQQQQQHHQPLHAAAAPSAPTHPLIGNPPDVNLFRQPPMSPVSPAVPSDFIRCSMSKIPKTQALLAKSKIPLGITVTPYPKGSEPAVPVISGVIVRCRKCRSYLNPYVEQIEQGARWRCNLCMLINDYPPSFDVDPATQQYTDRSQKTELNCPVYEFVAPVEYMIRAPQPPAFVFVIDVSYLAVSSGMTATATKIILDCLDKLPNEMGLSRIAILAVDSAVHFFTLGLSVSEPQSLVVPDLKDIVIPSRASDLLVSISECRANIEAILQRLPTLFSSTQKSVVAFGSALNTACNLVAPIGGKVVGLLSGLPTLGEGSLQPRDDSKLYGTPRESSLLQPATNFYKLLAAEATKNQIAVDLFLFPSSYMDIATISCISRYTGGQLYLYPGFNSGRTEDAVKFTADFSSFLGTQFGMEAVLRIRATQGISIPAYHGSFFFRSSDLLALPNVSPEHSYAAQLSVDETLPSRSIGIQAAFLHTTCSGERRIRVINGSFLVSDDPREVVQWIDTGATADLMTKIAIDKVLAGKIEDGRDYLISKLSEIFTYYRSAYGIGQNTQLQVCDSLRTLPVLVLGALKSLAIRCTANVPIDIRSFFMSIIKSNSITDNVYLIAPYLLPIHLLPDAAGVPDPGTGDVALPPSLNLSSDRIERNGVYLLDDGREIVFYIGSGASAEMCLQLFGQPYHQLAGGKIFMAGPQGPLARRIASIMNKLAQVHRSAPFVYLVKEDSEPGLRALFFSRLIEDRGATDSLPSYHQFLTMIRDKSNS